ncbi:S8 family serine peptidase [Paenibacillus chartarius]|uniref:S8 family serine peptidase n=1 Tax=Paenibacillus chartarius TaxID=747481 RepID=A0ABV6DS45_9BACL
MDTVRFLKRLNDEIGSSAPSSRRLIIRFENSQAFAACMNEWNRRKHVWTHLTGIQPLPIINGISISCAMEAKRQLLAFPFIADVETDTKKRLQLGYQPNMSSHPASSRRPPVSPHIPWGVNQIRAPQAWRRATGHNVRVGVIDTGIDPSHPDLRRCIGRGINLVNRSIPPLDDNGHGTHIAGTIAGAGLQQNGVIGVAPRATIHAVKAFDSNGSAYVSDIIAGIDWCVQNDLDIINMSFGMKSYNKSLELAVLNAFRSGKIIVASSGNDGRRSFIDYPARFPQVISVGATTRANKVAPFTNRGRRIDIFAPGENVYSAWLHGKYHELSGTSMATSHVSGVVALLLSVRPGLRTPQVKELLRRTSVMFEDSKKAGVTAGRIHARRAVAELLRGG